MTNEPSHTDALLVVVLRALRRKKLLYPADLTEIAVQAGRLGIHHDTKRAMLRIAAETVMDREEKRETPRKHD